MTLGDQVTRLIDYGAQLLGVEGVILVGIDLQHLEQAAGDAVDQPDQRRERHHQPLEDPGGGIGDLLRKHGGQGLWRHFTEYQHHQSQAEGGDGDPEITKQPDTDDGGDGGGEDIDQIIADQDQSQQAIGAGEQLLDATCGFVFGLCQMPQFVAVDGHQAGFGTGEKGGKKDQDNENNQ